MGTHRYQPRGQVLPSHGGRPEAARERAGAMAGLLAPDDGRARGDAIDAHMKRIVRVDGPSRSKADVEREIALHLELRAAEFEAAGMSPAEAKVAALEAFGDRSAIESEVQVIHDQRTDERRSQEWREEVGQDARVAVRMLRRSRA